MFNKSFLSLSALIILTSIAFVAAVQNINIIFAEPEKFVTENNLDTARVLKALDEDWMLVDDNPDVDFLVFVNESRDEADFYPKKEFIKEMVRSDLIKDLSGQTSEVYESGVHYEGNPLKGEWREITTANSIVYQYQVTPKGRELLRRAPKVFGQSIPSLKIAETTLDIESKLLKVAVYDKQAIQRIVADFVEKAESQVEAAFSPQTDTDPNKFSQKGLRCGKKLWQKLQAGEPQSNTRRSIVLVQRSYGANGEVSETMLDDTLILDDLNAFWKKLRTSLQIKNKPHIRQADAAETAIYLDKDQVRSQEFPPPNLSSYAVVFIIESDGNKLAAVVESVIRNETEKYEPSLKRIDLIEEIKN